MARTRNTADLLLNVSARVGRPAADGLLSDAELLDRIDEEMRSELTALLVSLRSEYLLRSTTIATVVGTASYRIPDRAAGMTVREVLITDGTYEWNATQVAVEDAYAYTGTRLSAGPAPYSFTLRDGYITLLPTPTATTYSIVIKYVGRLSRLIETTAGAAISSAVSTTKLSLVTSPTPPSTVTTVGALIDVIRGDGCFEPMYSDEAVSAWSTPELTIAPAITVAEISTSTTQNARVDYVCPAGQTVYPQVPESLWPCLVSLGCRVYCEAIGDRAGMSAANAVYEKHLANAHSIMQPRVAGEMVKPVGRSSPLRGAYPGRWR